MHTEKEAAALWCPHSRSIEPRTSSLPSMNGTQNFTCIASQCMAWRWTGVTVINALTMETVNDEPKRGYCGLSGALSQ